MNFWPYFVMFICDASAACFSIDNSLSFRTKITFDLDVWFIQRSRSYVKVQSSTSQEENKCLVIVGMADRD